MMQGSQVYNSPVYWVPVVTKFDVWIKFQPELAGL